ncbi:MAG: APC family permease [Actinomycetota bacterium]|nr:MAG: APC family permease [Actinomycetota bacterium]
MPSEIHEENHHPESEQLAHGALSLLDSVVMGVAGVAPAFTIAASTAALSAAVGLGGPSSLLYSGIAMFGIVWAFHYLGNREASAGATYTWVRNLLHPVLGYLAGWSMIVSALIFMVAGTLPAGSLAVGLFSQNLANNVVVVGIVGITVFILVIIAVGLGVKIAARLQVLLSTIELAVLLLFAVLMLSHGNRVHTFSWVWLSPTVFHGVSGFFAGALVAAFYYWGWDVTANLAEETAQPRRNPGLGALLGVAVVFSLFEIFTIASNLLLTQQQIQVNAGDVLGILGQIVWPGLGGKAIVVAVVLSTVATLETSIVQVTRTLYVMGRDGTLPNLLGRIHPRSKTPVIATVIIGLVPLLLLFFALFIGSLETILQDAINAVGLQIAVYYSLAGFTVVLAYRRSLLSSFRLLIFAGLWPLLGATFMVTMFFVTIPRLNTTTQIVGIGALLLGIVPAAFSRIRAQTSLAYPVLQPDGKAIPK